MSTLAQDFNVGAVQGGHYQRMDVTLTWDSDVPMEFRLHMWRTVAREFVFGPNGWRATEKTERVEVVWSIPRDLLAGAVGMEAPWTPLATEGVMATRVRVDGTNLDSVYLFLPSKSGEVTFSVQTERLAQLVRSSLHKVPTESEAIDVDGLITQIFHAEEAE